MISLIISIGVLALIYWIDTVIPVPQPFLRIILVVLVIVAVLTVLSAFRIATGLPSLR